jgi:hypothetical protein
MRCATVLTAMTLSAGVLAGPTDAGAKGIPASGVIDLAAEADASLVGGGAGERTGFAVAQVGDVNGDGTPDVAVSAPDAAGPDRPGAGVVTIVFGPVTGKLDLDKAPGLRIVGAAAKGQLGLAVAPAGDVNGDKLADVVIGAPNVAGGAGAAYVVAGRAETGTIDLAAPGAALQTIAGGAAGDGLGTSVAGLGDVDGDGVSDVAVGSPGADRAGTDGGAVDVVYGTAGGGSADVTQLGSAGLSIVGPQGALAGLSVAAAGDVDGDGHADVALGAPTFAPGGAPRGAAFVVRGRAGGGTLALDGLPAAEGWRFTGAHAGDFFGANVAATSDVDGDGHPDLVVGAPLAAVDGKEHAGSAYVLYLGAAPLTADLGDTLAPDRGMRIDGANEGEEAGAAIRGLGDLDGDKLADVVVTAPFAGALGRREAGVAYVIRAGKVAADKPADPVVLATSGLGAAGFRIVGPGEEARLYSATPGGDLDGDGAPDLLLGAVPPNGRASGGGAYAVFAPQPAPPAPPLPPDPGTKEEVAAGCRAATQVEIIIDDSGSMADSDPERLRAQAVQLLLAKPRNIGKELGAVEFGDLAGELFPPQPIRDPSSNPDQGSQLIDVVDKTVQADNGGTDYNAGFTAAGSAAPKADARIFLTDGEHNVGEYANGHRGGPPTYVVGLSIGRKGEAARRLQRIATETKGKYFPNVTAEKLQPVFNAIDSRLNCDIGLESFVDALSDQDTSEPNDVPLDPDTYSADIAVSWDEPGDLVTPGDVEVLDEDGDVVGRVTARMQRLALLQRGRKRLTFGDFKLRGRRGKTFYSVRINGVRGKTLRVRTATRTVRGRTVRVHTQVGQSRRRR